MSIEKRLIIISEENALVDSDDSDHDELNVQKLDTLQHKMISISDDITTSTVRSHDDG